MTLSELRKIVNDPMLDGLADWPVMATPGQHAGGGVLDGRNKAVLLSILPWSDTLADAELTQEESLWASSILSMANNTTCKYVLQKLLGRIEMSKTLPPVVPPPPPPGGYR